MFDDDIDSVLAWAKKVGLIDIYFDKRTLFLEGIHQGAVAGLPRHNGALYQLMSDVGQLKRMGTIADGTKPWQIWRTNVIRWAKVFGQVTEVEPAAAEPVVPPAEPEPQVIEAEKVRVLFLEANVFEKTPVNCEEERERIGELVDDTPEHARLDLASWPDVTFAQMTQQLVNHKPRVMHFSGHGLPDGSLVMRRHPDGEGENHANVAPQPLVDALQITARSVRLIVLNACYSEALAQKLIAAMDVVVIGMSRAVMDGTAIRFAEQLYGKLFAGLSIRDAHIVTRAILAGETRPDADRPKLVARPDSKLPSMKLWD